MKPRICLLTIIELLTGLHQAVAQANFTLASTLNVAGGPASVAAADVNGDGKVDLISTGNGNSLVVYTNNGSGIFVSNASYSVGIAPIFVIATDVNNDGK